MFFTNMTNIHKIHSKNIQPYTFHIHHIFGMVHSYKIATILF